ncbi:integrase core domain-containing protein [Thalassospiraceae bacterium LMO-JJ14]|nr:integrase core domain-containing protein [Thalassospiraceae bacterium LMO-JJ14]
MQRQLPARPKLTSWDRLFFSAIYKVNPRALVNMLIVKPDTVIRWHRAGFRLFWKMKSSRVVGRPKVPAEIRNLIQEMSIDNLLWGAPRIHGELLKLGIDVSQSTVAKYMMKRRCPPSQGWRTFPRNHTDGIAAIDLFVVPTVGFKLLFGLVILDHDRRKMIHVNVTYHPTAEWIARQVVEAFPWDEAPRYLIRDRDASYGQVYVNRLSAMGIRDRPTAPRSPWQNAYVERVIGSIRRDLLDHVITLNERHLRSLLHRYADYYNGYRTHLGLDKDTPLGRAVQAVGSISALPQLGGLHHAYVRT